MHVRFLLLIGVLCVEGLCAAAHENVTRYLEYLPLFNFGQIGDYTKGEMQIIDNYNSILQVQNAYYDEFIERGCSPAEAEKYSRVGIVAEDKYWFWLRDPLVLPNGKTTAYNRFFPKGRLNGTAAVSVMSISNDNMVVVNVIFRHATRVWELELPRGGREKHETSEEAALRELLEETGIKAKSALKIASIAPDSGSLSHLIDIFVVKDFSLTNETNREDCESIHDCIFLSKQELKKAFVDGFIELTLHGHKTKVYCRDSFLASAILIAETKGIY